MKTLFLGGGNMAQAMLAGLVAQNTSPKDICVVEPLQEARDAVSALGYSAFAELTIDRLDCDAIVLAVKPQIMKSALAPFTGKLSGQVVISIAAGINTGALGDWLGSIESPYRNVVRAMPNTPALIRAGITGLYAAPGVSEAGRAMTDVLLGAVGKTVWFDDESMLDAVTAVSGSGPAYVFYFIEALEQAALELGFDGDNARQFAIQTFLGGAQLVASANESPGKLRARVTSKRGTTESAIDVFEKHAIKLKFIEGVKAACKRSCELGNELGARPTLAVEHAGGPGR